MAKDLLDVFEATKVICEYMLANGDVRAEITNIGTLRLYDQDDRVETYTPIKQDVMLLRTGHVQENEKQYRIGDKAICKMCNSEIEYVGPYWRHTGELQPRHPAMPHENQITP